MSCLGTSRQLLGRERAKGFGFWLVRFLDETGTYECEGSGPKVGIDGWPDATLTRHPLIYQAAPSTSPPSI